MKTVKSISVLLAVAIVVSLMTCSIVSNAATTPSTAKLTGTTQNSTKELSTGVRYTQMTAASGTKYGGTSGIEFNVVEADLSANNLYIDTVYGGTTCSHAYKKGTEIVKSFDSANSSLSPIAAINGDGWWMYTNIATEPANSNKKMLSGTGALVTPVGFSMSNGEIYASDRIPQESFNSTSGNIPYEDQISFGITSDFIPVISNPDAEVLIKNNTKKLSSYADGINRLPAYDSLIMYTDKGPKNNYANDDAFEVKIKITSTSNYVIKHGTNITGTVESVHAPGASNPTMTADSNYIILTARGSRYDDISRYKTGDSVTISVSIYDQYGKYTSEWQKVTDAVCGHIPLATDGSVFAPGIANNYPASIVGITNSGNVIMITAGATVNGSRKGLSQSVYSALAKELNLRDAFFLDGGGSSSLIVPSGNTYPMVNHYADSTGERQVPNMLILSKGTTRAAQGKFPAVLKKTANAVNIDFSNQANHAYISSAYDAYYYMKDGALKLTTPSAYDPYVTIDYTKSGTSVSASKYKYITIEYMLPTSNSAVVKRADLYYMCGGNTTIKTDCVATTGRLVSDGSYHKVTVDMSSKKNWSGALNGIRFDFFSLSKPNDTMYVKSISLSAEKPSAETAAPTKVPSTPTKAPSSTTTASTAAPVTDAPESMVPVATENVTENPFETEYISSPTPAIDDIVSDITVDNGKSDGTDKGLSMGALIGIVSGVTVLLIAIMAVVMVIIKKKQSS